MQALARAWPRARLDALADSLVAIATADGPLVETQRQAWAARGALRSAGSDSAPVPYAGAFDALVRIYHGNEPLRAGTLSAMTRLVDQDPVFRFFIEVATSDDTTAHRGLTLLLDEFGPEGEAAVHQLYREGQVTQPLAVRVLNRIAYHRGWDEGSTR
jgi:hypothetical protein